VDCGHIDKSTSYKLLKSGKEKSGGKTAAEFGWDTSKLQKITLFQARNAPLQRTTVRHDISRKRANFLNP